MTMKNFLHYYHDLNGAQSNYFFFNYKKEIYYYEQARVSPRWVKEGKESSKKGGHQKFRIYISVPERAKLVKKGAIKIMTAEEFKAIPYKNNGHKCEYWLHQTFNLGEYKPDHERFDKCGDVCINGIEYQVKFQNASLTNVYVLHKAQADARERRKAERKSGK